MLKKIGISLGIVCGLMSLALLFAILRPQSESGDSNRDRASDGKMKLGYFDYLNKEHGIQARIFLPEAAGDWAIENPWRNSNTSVVFAPPIFVVANFQSVSSPTFYGLVRVSYDLQGNDCLAVFTQLAKADGLALVKHSHTTIDSIVGANLFVIEYVEPTKKLTVGSKLLCANNSAIEVMVVTPNEAIYYASVNSIIENAQLRISTEGGLPK